MSGRRALHFVFKIGNRTKTTKFYRDVLGMKFLRHEEFEEGCKAACNGPYDGKWSKSMVGYGPEDNHFVVELTYNYGIGDYKMGNDFRGMTIHSKRVLENAQKCEWSINEDNGTKFVSSPDGHRFYVVEEDAAGDPVQKVSLACSNLQNSIDYWQNKCGMTVFSKSSNGVVLGFSENQCKLELVDIGVEVDHAKAFGRIAFGCPSEQLAGIEREMQGAGERILTPLVSLDTPGKATVQVVILADPDGHEICFVGDEAFRQLSQVDSKADSLLDEAILADKSDDWFAKKGKKKGSA